MPKRNGQIQVDKKQCRSWAQGAGGEKQPENNLRGHIGSQIDIKVNDTMDLQKREEAFQVVLVVIGGKQHRFILYNADKAAEYKFHVQTELKRGKQQKYGEI